MAKKVYAARVKDTGPDPKWKGEWHRVKTNQNPAGQWGKRAWAQDALDSALSHDETLIGHVFDEPAPKQVTVENINVDHWLYGKVVPVATVPEELRPTYRNTLHRVAYAAYKSGERKYVSSSFRTRKQQERLYAIYLAGGALAAVPGTSPHERGIALDIPNARQDKKFIKELAKLKVYDDVPSEKWHVTAH